MMVLTSNANNTDVDDQYINMKYGCDVHGIANCTLSNQKRIENQIDSMLRMLSTNN